MSTDGPAPKKLKTSGLAGTSPADGPVEDDKTAREKLREAGFNPDDVHTARSDLEAPLTRKARSPGSFAMIAVRVQKWNNITPMTYFAFHGDLPMCRYLHYVRNASTEMPAKKYLADGYWSGVTWYPLYAAITPPLKRDTLRLRNGSMPTVLPRITVSWSVGRPLGGLLPFSQEMARTRHLIW